jgi:hypothetical protein
MNKYLVKLAEVIMGPSSAGHGAIKAALGMEARQSIPNQTLQALSQIDGTPLKRQAIGALNLKERGSAIKPPAPQTKLPQKMDPPKMKKGL